MGEQGLLFDDNTDADDGFAKNTMGFGLKCECVNVVTVRNVNRFNEMSKKLKLTHNTHLPHLVHS